MKKTIATLATVALMLTITSCTTGREEATAPATHTVTYEAYKNTDNPEDRNIKYSINITGGTLESTLHDGYTNPAIGTYEMPTNATARITVDNNGTPGSVGCAILIDGVAVEINVTDNQEPATCEIAPALISVP